MVLSLMRGPGVGAICKINETGGNINARDGSMGRLVKESSGLRWRPLATTILAKSSDRNNGPGRGRQIIALFRVVAGSMDVSETSRTGC